MTEISQTTSEATAGTRATSAGAVGVVVIGRNEGERLARCLESALGAQGRQGDGRVVVYVDSASTDGSVDYARSRGAEVVELDMSLPFSAARARNEGFARLLELAPDTELVQFVDGDCELVEGWIERGLAELERAPELAVVCGRRSERHREASVYNRLCDMEWNTPVGDAASCGGDALMRVSAFDEVGGFDPRVIAGEEPELCVRLRTAGWGVRRLDAPMTVHDAAMTRFGQWWRRALRHGHAIAESVATYGQVGGTGDVRRIGSALVWGLAVPLGTLAALAAGAWTARPALGGAAALLALTCYAVLTLRILRHRRARGEPARDARAYALFCLLAKLPESLGVLRYRLDRLRGRAATVIEYK